MNPNDGFDYENKRYSCISITVAGLLASAGPMNAAPILPPQFIKGDKAINLETGDQPFAPEIAGGGNVTLTVWQDETRVARQFAGAVVRWETSSDIYGARIGTPTAN